MMLQRRKTVLTTGHCRSPEGTALHEEHRFIGVALEVDYESDIIVDADFTFITQLSREFFRRLLIGYDLKNGMEPLKVEFEERFLAPSQEAIFMAIKVAVQRYFAKVKKK